MTESTPHSVHEWHYWAWLNKSSAKLQGGHYTQQHAHYEMWFSLVFPEGSEGAMASPDVEVPSRYSPDSGTLFSAVASLAAVT